MMHDSSMSTTRITISVPEQIAVKAQRAVESGHADSMSGYFTALAEREPDWAEAAQPAASPSTSTVTSSCRKLSSPAIRDASGRGSG